MANTKNYGGEHVSKKGFFLFIFSCFLVLYAFFSTPPVFDCKLGEHTFYLYSKSSNASVVNLKAYPTTLERFCLMGVRGESVFIEDFKKGKGYAQVFIQKKRAKLLFCEEVDGIVCRYYYSPLIFNYVKINGMRVNLHVIESGQGVTIATPLAFDGF